MNKKGQTNLYLAIIIGLMIFMMGFLFVNFIKNDVTTARTALDCTNSSISDGTKATCLITDTVVPYLIVLIFSAAGGIILARLTL